MTTSGEEEYERILVLLRLGRLDAARTKLGALLAVDPADASALLLLGYAWYIDDVAERAVEYLTAGLSHDPDNQMGLRILALSELMRCGEVEDNRTRLEHYRRAQDAATRCAELGPGDPDNLRALALVQDVLDPDEAVRTLDRALDIDPESALLHCARGIILRRKRISVAEAENALREALRLDPVHLDAMQELAFLELARGNKEAGERGLRAVAEQDPSRGDFVRKVLASGKDPISAPGWVERSALSAADRLADGLGGFAERMDERSRRPREPRTARRFTGRFVKVWLALFAVVFLVRLVACDPVRDIAPPPRAPVTVPAHAPLPTLSPFLHNLPTFPPWPHKPE